MFFFEYIFYRIYQYGDRVGELAVNEYTIIVVSALQMTHLLTVFILFDLMDLVPFPFNKYSGLALIAIPLSLNFIRYKSNYQQKLESKFEKESREIRLRKGTLVVLYIILSLSICFSLAIFLGGQNNP